MGRKAGSKDKVQRKSRLKRTLMYSLPSFNPAVGAYLAHRDISQTGKERKASNFLKTGAVVGSIASTTQTALGIAANKKLAKNPLLKQYIQPISGKQAVRGLADSGVKGALGGAALGLGAYYVRRANAKDKKKFKSGY